MWKLKPPTCADFQGNFLIFTRALPGISRYLHSFYNFPLISPPLGCAFMCAYVSMHGIHHFFGIRIFGIFRPAEKDDGRLPPPNWTFWQNFSKVSSSRNVLYKDD